MPALPPSRETDKTTPANVAVSAPPQPPRRSPFVCVSAHCQLLHFVGGRPHPFGTITPYTITSRASERVRFHTPLPSSIVLPANASVLTLSSSAQTEGAERKPIRVDEAEAVPTHPRVTVLPVPSDALFPPLRVLDEAARRAATPHMDRPSSPSLSEALASGVWENKQKEGGGSGTRRGLVPITTLPCADQLAEDSYRYDFFGTVPRERPRWLSDKSSEGLEKAAPGQRNGESASARDVARAAARRISGLLLRRYLLQAILVLQLPGRSSTASFTLRSYRAVAEPHKGRDGRPHLTLAVTPRLQGSLASPTDDRTVVFELADATEQPPLRKRTRSEAARAPPASSRSTSTSTASLRCSTSCTHVNSLEGGHQPLYTLLLHTCCESSSLENLWDAITRGDSDGVSQVVVCGGTTPDTAAGLGCVGDAFVSSAVFPAIFQCGRAMEEMAPSSPTPSTGTDAVDDDRSPQERQQAMLVALLQRSSFECLSFLAHRAWCAEVIRAVCGDLRAKGRGALTTFLILGLTPPMEGAAPSGRLPWCSVVLVRVATEPATAPADSPVETELSPREITLAEAWKCGGVAAPLKEGTGDLWAVRITSCEGVLRWCRWKCVSKQSSASATTIVLPDSATGTLAELAVAL